MAEIDIAPHFGAELKDGFKPVNAWVTLGVQWLDDIQAFYRERSAIEKEYAQKLSALAKKYFDKKSKKSSSLSVGENPTVTPGSLESASMTTWGVQLSTLEGRAAEHDKFASQLLSNLAEPLKNLAARYEDLRRQHAEYAGKLEKEREGGYADLKRVKGKYDGVCQEVENRRKKIESSFDHGKGKAQAAYQQQLSDMRNAKNTYLIAINVTNKQKERYYHEYVPELLESIQGLSEARTGTLNSIWSTASSIETQTLTRSTQLLTHLSHEIPRNNPVLDSMMFVRHNTAPSWQDPPDFAFEPSPVWLDDDAMAADPNSKTFLMNILTKSKSSLTPLRHEVENHRREVEGAKRVRLAIREGRDKRDEVEIVRAQFVHQESLHECERRKITAEIEVSTITAAVGDVSANAKTHAFKPQTFKIPTNCDLCGDRIWGLSAKGLSCEECGFTCHMKCELKVPANCPGELNKEQKKSVKVERQALAQQQSAAPVSSSAAAAGEGMNGAAGGGNLSNNLQRSDTIASMNTLSSGYAASAHRSVSGTAVGTRSSVASAEDGGGGGGPSPPGSSAGGPPPPGPTRRRLVAPPPASSAPAPTSEANGDADADRDKGGRMLYSYIANGEGEISLSENQPFTLLEPDDGSGWIRIRPSSSHSSSAAGLVPASYTELITPTSSQPRPTSTASSTNNSGSDTAAPPRVKKQGPAVAPRRGGAAKKKVQYVEALYDYSATAGSGEVDMRVGERMVLCAPDSGDGWCEVEREGGKGRGVVPASWVREV